MNDIMKKEGFWVLFWMESGRGHTVRDETYVFLRYEDGYSEDEEDLRSLANDWCKYDKEGCDLDRYKYGFDIVQKPPNSWLEKELKKLRCNSEEIMRQENLVKSELGIKDVEGKEKLLEEAIAAVNLFDQANTGRAIELLGSRGKIAKDAIDDLRDIINKDGKLTMLTREQI